MCYFSVFHVNLCCPWLQLNGVFFLKTVLIRYFKLCMMISITTIEPHILYQLMTDLISSLQGH